MIFKRKNNKKEKLHIDFRYNWKIFWSFLKNYKLMVVILLFLVLLHEAKQIADKYLFKIVIDYGTSFIAGTTPYETVSRVLLYLAAGFLGLTLLSVIVNWLKEHFLIRLENNLIVDLKRRFFNHLISLDHEFHVSHKTGGLISRLKRGSNAIEGMLDILIFNFAPLMLQLIIASISLVYFDWVPALIILITTVVFIAFNLYMQKAQEESRIIANKTEDIEKGNTSDIFTNIDSIRYFGKENLIKNKYKRLTEDTKRAFMRNWDYHRMLTAGQSLIIGAGTFLLMLFPILSFLRGELTIGTLTFIYAIYVGLIGPMFGFVSGIRAYYRSMADFQELFEYNKIEKRITDKPNANPIQISEGEIEFKDVDFSYGERRIFRNFNLKIPKNKKVAFVGHSGCGKTTLVKLIYRLYDINKGNILVDGKNIRDVKQESLREEMSIVPQEAILFDDTIYNNVAFSDPKASREEVMRAIKFAQLDKIIKRFPNQENTIVGERGVKLSGGEKQRVSIARAILANKKILVLDEATSALDSETEFEIQKDLKKLMQGRTSIIIAHRLSTIMHADIIVVMKNGKIEQMGTHRDLITQGGEYQRLWDFQKGGYVE
jgi:ATP-binding cassette, subfamily B, heavy metal transporter